MYISTPHICRLAKWKLSWLWKWISILIALRCSIFLSFIVHSSHFFPRPTWERWHENCFGKLNAVTFNYVIIQHVDMSELWTRKLRWECDIEEKRIRFNERAQKNVLIWRLHQFSVIMWLQEQKTTPTSQRERCICREAIDILDDATCFRL